MISHNTSISSFGKRKSPIKEQDYELLHYFDDQSDSDSCDKKSKSKKNNNKDSLSYSSGEDSKEDNFFEYDKDSDYDLNGKVMEKSPDGNYGKVNKNFINIKIIFYNIV